MSETERDENRIKQENKNLLFIIIIIFVVGLVGIPDTNKAKLVKCYNMN